MSHGIQQKQGRPVTFKKITHLKVCWPSTYVAHSISIQTLSAAMQLYQSAKKLHPFEYQFFDWHTNHSNVIIIELIILVFIEKSWLGAKSFKYTDGNVSHKTDNNNLFIIQMFF